MPRDRALDSAHNEKEQAVIQVPTALETFITEVETLLAAESEPHRVTDGVRRRLAHLLESPDFLPPEQREPDPEHYRTHLLAIAPSRKFSVVALIWLPGQVTPIHDHICWCCVGVLQGLEHEQRYTLRENGAGEQWLAPLAVDVLTAGHTCALVPPDENIHQVRNAGEDLAISIHVYGDDLAIWGSSINQCFDGLPVRDDLSGAAVAWRRVKGTANPCAETL
jgi:predicted metal-dependent enzyme (double-stranded beta helix superfamily)